MLYICVAKRCSWCKFTCIYACTATSSQIWNKVWSIGMIFNGKISTWLHSFYFLLFKIYRDPVTVLSRHNTRILEYAHDAKSELYLCVSACFKHDYRIPESITELII